VKIHVVPSARSNRGGLPQSGGKREGFAAENVEAMGILAKPPREMKSPGPTLCRSMAILDHDPICNDAVPLMRFQLERGVTERGASGAPDAVSQREAYFFELYRVFEAALFVGFCYSPLARDTIELISPATARIAAVLYLIAATVLFATGRRRRRGATGGVMLGLGFDLIAALTAIATIRGLDGGIATLLLVNVSGAALLLKPTLAYGFALLCAIGVIAVFGLLGERSEGGMNWTIGALAGSSYVAAVILLQSLRRQISETERLVAHQEGVLANLAQLNELIIRRMRTGVIVVDGANRIHQFNEAAWHLIGNPASARRELQDVAPELSRRIYHWRTSGNFDAMPVSLAEGMPEVIPRFARLGAGDQESAIIFLDDISLLSRQAEQLTLSSLGRLSASIAHEVRNPLAAISYSSQLLAESALDDADQRLVDIVRAQCARVNSIIENILQLSRRERSHPENVDLTAWTQHFVEEYRNTNPTDRDEIRAIANSQGLIALVDPTQLQQVVWNLVQNARRYGRLPEQPARVAVIARRAGSNNAPVIEVVDRGPGIPPRLAAQVFDPFFTTSEHGTGLGLYIARQLCEANQGALELVPVAGGGSCFRITLLAPAAGPADRDKSRRSTQTATVRA
jgi:two-component system sensor histidine kinase PilS (NtrC family)